MLDLFSTLLSHRGACCLRQSTFAQKRHKRPTVERFDKHVIHCWWKFSCIGKTPPKKTCSHVRISIRDLCLNMRLNVVLWFTAIPNRLPWVYTKFLSFCRGNASSFRKRKSRYIVYLPSISSIPHSIQRNQCPWLEFQYEAARWGFL